MRSIETQATLTAEGILTAKIPFEIPPGEHWVVIVIEENEKQQPFSERLRESLDVNVKEGPLRFSAYPVGLVSEDFTFRREDLYDDTI